MPFTPFHWGPALLIGMLLEKRINIPAIMIGSVIIDVWVTFLFFTGRYPHHGLLHTYLGASIAAVVVIISLLIARKRLKKITDGFLLQQQNYSLTSIALGAIIGTWSHVFLDSLLYPEMIPFWPFDGNPMLDLVPGSFVYIFAATCFLPGVGIYLYKFYFRLKKLPPAEIVVKD